jgi:hypothetical protein
MNRNIVLGIVSLESCLELHSDYSLFMDRIIKM